MSDFEGGEVDTLTFPLWQIENLITQALVVESVDTLDLKSNEG